MSTFSERHRFRTPDPEITITHSAPQWVGERVLELAYSYTISSSRIRDWLCDCLVEIPDRYLDPMEMDQEVERLLMSANWYFTYDLAEWVYDAIRQINNNRGHSRNYVAKKAEEYGEALNRFFRAKGVGWQMIAGKLEVRGSQVFEEFTRTAIELTSATGRKRAETELREALSDLSRRPEPEISGAIQHGMAALECLTRDITNDPKLTLGEWIKKHREKFPKPLDSVIEKLWGYASENGRHIKEGSLPSIEDAELLIGLVGAFSVYLMRKTGGSA